MSFLKRRSDEQVPAIPVPAKFLRQPLVPVVPTRMSPKTCSLSAAVGMPLASPDVPMPTLPSGRIATARTMSVVAERRGREAPTVVPCAVSVQFSAATMAIAPKPSPNLRRAVPARTEIPQRIAGLDRGWSGRRPASTLRKKTAHPVTVVE